MIANTNNLYKYDSTYTEKALSKVSSFDVSSNNLTPYSLLALRRRNFKFIIAFFTKGNCSIFSDKYGFTRSSLASLLSGKVVFTQSYATKITKAVNVPINTIDILEEDRLLQTLLDNVSPEHSQYVPQLSVNINNNYPLEHEVNRKIASQRLFELKKSIKYLLIVDSFPVTGYQANRNLSSPAEEIPINHNLGKTNSFSSPFNKFANKVNVAQANTLGLNRDVLESEAGNGFFLDLIDVEASAGPGTFTDSYQSSEKIFISAHDYYLYLSGENPNNLKVIKVRGDSMEPILKNGQTCVVRLGKTFTNQGIYVFTYSNVTYIKRLTQANNNLIAISENQAYPPFIIEHSESLEIHGKLVLALEYTKI